MVMRIRNYLLSLVAAGALAGGVNAQSCGYEVVGLIDQMGRKMQLLAEDVQVEVRDPRCQALAGQANDILQQLQHMRAEAQQVSPQHMREEAVELDQKFHRFIAGAAVLGGSGQYLARSAERVEELDHQLMRLVSNPVPPANPQPVYTPPQPAPNYQPVPSVAPGPYTTGYPTYPVGRPLFRRGRLEIYLRR
jgi:hypothetical protein